MGSLRSAIYFSAVSPRFLAFSANAEPGPIL